MVLKPGVHCRKNINKLELEKFDLNSQDQVVVRTIGESVPQGLSSQGLVTLFPVTDSAWKRITLGSLAITRRAATLQNIDGFGTDNPAKILINYALPATPAVPPTVLSGITVAEGAERFYDVNDNVDFYVRVEAGGGSFDITFEEIA